MKERITREQIAAWLAAVHGDPHIDALAFKLAFALSLGADESGLIRTPAVAKIVLSKESGAIPITDVLGRLAAHGYLKACGKGPKISGFRIIAPIKAMKTMQHAASASIVPFPADRRGAFVHKQAARMAALTPTHGEAHLRQQLKIQADTMRRRGVAEDAIGREVRKLQSAIRAQLWRLVLTPEQPSPGPT